MHISKKIAQALNQQCNAELYSAYLYLSMSAWAASENFPGIAHWLKQQATEEQEHAMKLFDYVLERGGEIELDKIDKPTAKWDSFLALFKNVWDHEQKVTAMIYELAGQADAEKDYATKILLDWFIKEQVEEEATAESIYKRVEISKGSNSGLFYVDHELGKRGRN